MEEVINSCAVNSTTIWHKLSQFLGYGDCLQPDFEGDPYDVDYAEASLQSVVFIHFGIVDRLRLLLTGNAIVRTSIKTDVIVTRSYSKSNISIGTIGYRP